MINSMRTLWEKKRIWIIIVCVQVLLNIVGQFLWQWAQLTLMFSSGCVLLVLSVYAVYCQRNNVLMMLLNIVLLYFNYSLVASVYWNTGSLDPIFSSYSWNEFLRGINIELVFFGTYVVFLRENNVIDNRVFLQRGKPVYCVVIACAAYIVLAPFLFYHTEAFGTRGVVTAFYEYSLIVLIVALCLCNRDIKAIGLLLAASVWLIVHGILHGERVLALQLMIVWGLYLLLHVLTVKLIIPACIGGIFFFTVFGMYRGLSDLDGNVLESVFNSLLRGGLANDTSYAAYQTSMNILRFADITSLWNRLLYFLKYLLYIVAGSAVPDVNLSILALEVGGHGGGGWLPTYAYFWLGYIGVIAAGVGLAWLVNTTTNLQKRRSYLNYLALYIVATSPRWYLYSPSPLTRGLLMFTLFFVVAVAAEKIVSVVGRTIQKWVKDRGKS